MLLKTPKGFGMSRARILIVESDEPLHNMQAYQEMNETTQIIHYWEMKRWVCKGMEKTKVEIHQHEE
jgi:hypothetical protein